MKYTIPVYRKDNLLKRLEKFNRKAIKFHALPIIYTVSEPYDKEFHKEEWSAIEAERKDVSYFISMVDVDIDTESFKPIKGYQFIASIEHTENGNIISKIPVGYEIPKRYRDSGHFCDHCKTNRFRKNTFIVFNEKKKTFVQVGSTCIKDYLGINLDLIATRFGFLDELTSAGDEKGFSREWIEPRYSLETFIATALNIISIDGYVSGKKQWETEGAYQATGGTTMSVLNGPYGKINEKEREWYRLRREFSEENKAEALTIIEWVKQQPITEDYYYNLNTIIKNNWVKSKISNLAASMIISYRIAMDKMVKKREYAKSEYIGKEGEKITVTATALKTFWCESKFGTMYIHNFVTEKGERLVWYNSADNIEQDVVYEITATVKKHQLYKDMKQTVILRPKIKEI